MVWGTTRNATSAFSTQQRARISQSPPDSTSSPVITSRPSESYNVVDSEGLTGSPASGPYPDPDRKEQNVRMGLPVQDTVRMGLPVRETVHMGLPVKAIDVDGNGIPIINKNVLQTLYRQENVPDKYWVIASIMYSKMGKISVDNLFLAIYMQDINVIQEVLEELSETREKDSITLLNTSFSREECPILNAFTDTSPLQFARSHGGDEFSEHLKKQYEELIKTI